MTFVIPGRRDSGAPGIHNPCMSRIFMDRWLWIPGSSLRSAPE